jgi:hypothetical protein
MTWRLPGAPEGTWFRFAPSLAVARVTPGRVWLVSADSAESDYFGVARIGYKLDATGALMRSDWRQTTYKYVVNRTAALDVDSIARAWAQLDAAGRAVGTLSPVDTLRATIGTAQVIVSYGRPARRGRKIWDGLVPNGAVWRFGADFATHLSSSADLVVGGTTIPAGRYTLWMQPEADGSGALIVSRLVNVFGTNYNPSQDLARIPLRRAVGPQEVERFTLAVESGRLLIRWAEVEWSVDVRAPRP